MREKLSRKRAQVRQLLGQPAGFFTQYDFASSVVPIEEYPAFTEACQRADLTPVFEALRDPILHADPFFTAETDHLPPLDAVIDYAVLGCTRPAKVLEIGSGRSTHVICRALADLGRGEVTCIDPAPRLDIGALPVTMHRRVAAVEDVALVANLEAGDVLYIDSSHILQPGTDCDIQLNLMFPRLRPGVVVHLHDIFLPYAYPREWAPRNWNEACGLAPWVMSGAFEVVFPTFFVASTRPDELYGAAPAFVRRSEYPGASFWMRKR